MPRYIRLSINAGTNGGNNGLLTVSDLQVINSVGTNLASGRATSQSSFYSSTSSAAVDGNTTGTYWATGSGTGNINLNGAQWMWVDLGASYTDIQTIQVTTWNGTSSGYGCITDYKIEASEDASNWVEWVPFSVRATPAVGATRTDVNDVRGLTTNRFLLQNASDNRIYTISAAYQNVILDNPVYDASSEASASQKPYMAFDGNPSNIWRSSGVLPQWLSIEFYQQVQVNQVRLYGQGGSVSQWPMDFTIEGWDGAKWIVLKGVVGNTYTYPTVEPQIFNFANWVTYQKYRIVVTRVASGSIVSIPDIVLTKKTVTATFLGTTPTAALFTSNGFTDPTIIDDMAFAAIGASGNVAAKVLTYTSDHAALLSGQRNIKMFGVPTPRIVYPVADINISNLQDITSVTVNATEKYGGVLRVIASVDSGATWKTWNPASGWVTVAANNSSVKANGMTAATLASITRTQWTQLTGTPMKIRFAYYLEATFLSDVALLDQITINANQKGTWKKAIHGTDYDYEYGDNTTLNVYFFKNGDYKINY